jgi:hypothetical protein
VSERVALRLVLPGVVVTWFVTGFPDLERAGGSHPVLPQPAHRQEKLTMAGRVSEGLHNMAGTIPSAVSCGQGALIGLRCRLWCVPGQGTPVRGERHGPGADARQGADGDAGDRAGAGHVPLGHRPAVLDHGQRVAADGEREHGVRAKLTGAGGTGAWSAAVLVG